MSSSGSAAAVMTSSMAGHSIIQRQVDSGITLPGEGALRVAVEVRMPAPSALRPVALVCLPGGGMNRHYFDLSAKDGKSDAMSFSFARQMAARGFIVVMMDYLGIGGSDQPADGYALTPDVLVQASAHALDQVLLDLRAQVPGLATLGVGHSMGAMMTVLQQAAHRQHAGIALLGFSTRGLPEYLIPAARELALSDPTAVRACMVELARKTFFEPYPVIKPSAESSNFFAGAKADPRAASIIRPAATHLLPVPAFMSMLPGNVAPEAAQIDVPVFLGLGELDIAGPANEIPPAFSASPDVSLHIWPATGHSHFLFPARGELFEQVAEWAGKITGK
jgi:pimeloyl-ACP methyl ester carboxylesterase